MISSREYWEMLDSKIQREVSWIQQRMSWLATFQGLLFASFGLLLQQGFENIPFQRKIIVLAIACLGIFISIGTLFGLGASNHVLKNINDEWNKLVSEEERAQFPIIRTKKEHRLLGMLSSWGPSILFLIVWSIVVCLILIK